MTKPAAMDAQLVNARNVGCHKSVALTLHIPEERAAEFFEMFGWPTMANPIPIAIARLDPTSVRPGQERPRTTQDGPALLADGTAPNTGGGHEVSSEATHTRHKGSASNGKPATEHPRTAFRDMRMPNQAGILCETEAFRKFIAERVWKEGFKSAGPDKPMQPDAVADYVRHFCNVKSRSDIRPRTPSGDRWQRLVDEYRTWMHQPEFA